MYYIATRGVDIGEPLTASEVQPPVMNCCPLPWPTFLAPALLGVTWAKAVKATVDSEVSCGPGMGDAR